MANESNKDKSPSRIISDRIVENSITASRNFNLIPSSAKKLNLRSLDQRSNGNTASTFTSPEKITEKSGMTLDQGASSYADKQGYSATGIWEYDLGFAAGRARKKKIEEAGGKEAFKAAKEGKREAKKLTRIGEREVRAGNNKSSGFKKSITGRGNVETVKEAKKQIRKGGSVSGGANVVDGFGYKHGYDSDKLNNLNNSRLVTRKSRQESNAKLDRKKTMKSFKGLTGEPKYGKHGDPSETFTKKEARKIGREYFKEDKQVVKKYNSSSRQLSRQGRKNSRKS